MQLFVMYANVNAMYSATGFISDAGILLYPAEQSFLKVFGRFISVYFKEIKLSNRLGFVSIL